MGDYGLFRWASPIAGVHCPFGAQYIEKKYKIAEQGLDPISLITKNV
jgi:hypothetical protein